MLLISICYSSMILAYQCDPMCKSNKVHVNEDTAEECNKCNSLPGT